MNNARVLVVAGSDSGGGAGIQADIKTVTALRGYAATAITVLTAQDTLGVKDVLPIPADFIAAQLRVVLADIGADCVKTGMLHDAEAIECVTAVLEQGHSAVPLVVDPVMVAQSGDRLLLESAVVALRERLIPRSTLITPNLPEAEVLLDRPIADDADREAAARELLTLGCGAVLLKGGHSEDDPVIDILASADGVIRFSNPRIHTPNGHGTGCTLASAIATGIAQGLPLERAVRRARAYLQQALETAVPLGQGQGPVNHAHTVMWFDGG